MDDLSGLDWNAKAKAPSSYGQFSTQTPSYARAQASTLPVNLASQPRSRPSSSLSRPVQAPIKSISPANDSFSTLFSTNPSKGQSNLTLQDRQKQLIEEKRRQEVEQQKRHADEARLWDTLGSGSQTPELGLGQSNGRSGAIEAVGDEDDLLAAFSSSAKVDRSSHFPPPSSGPVSGRGTPLARAEATNPIRGVSQGNGAAALADDDDDPFGLSSITQRSQPAASVPTNGNHGDDDDDILGDLARPVSTKPKVEVAASQIPEPASGEPDRSRSNGTPLDRSVAELVDMGFPPEKATEALRETNGDVQSAVGWLLNQAHEESKQKSRAREGSERRPQPTNERIPSDTARRKRPEQTPDAALPSWMRQEQRAGAGFAPQRTESRSPEKDVTQYATEFGTTIFNSANTLWKTGQKKVQKAVAEFQQEGNSTGTGIGNQPKWMRDGSTDAPTTSAPSELPPRPDQGASSQRRKQQQQAPNMTDEALLLESGGVRPQRQTTQRQAEARPAVVDDPVLRGRSPAQPLPERLATQPRFMQQARQQPVEKINRQKVEEEASQAYVSSARRRRPPPAPVPESQPEVDLFSPPPPAQAKPRPVTKPSQPKAQTTSASSMPLPSRPKPAARSIPPVSSSVLSAAHQQRKKGTEAFKRGDYAAAHEAYTAALASLPPTHPITVVVLTNRALTAIKTGEPKTAVSDADRALEIVGQGRGEGESIDLGAGEGSKDMKEFYGKALMRKGEALEHMEKWSDAGQVWREAIAAGVGGAVSLQGRDRCERATNGGAAKAVTSKSVKVVPKIAKATPARTAVGNAASTEAVKKLRAANAAAAQADDEKFQLSDSVTAKVDAWKGGKSDNLRALLGSLDLVLWPEAGWKKVGMSDLVMPNKVKIIYMKAIAKVHPDKVC